jgi:hypothetical protein
MVKGSPSLSETLDSSATKLVWLVPLATAAATLANVVFYYVITRLFDIGLRFPSETPPGSLGWIGVDEVILFSVIFATGAGLVFGLVVHVANRPIRTYLFIAGVVLLLSLALPLKIPTPPVAMIDKLSLVANTFAKK